MDSFFIVSTSFYNAPKENSFTYAFESGINYFVGKNNSGKTEFYKFIDYMFGASEKINNKVWYKGTLQKAKLYFAFNNIEYRATRIINNDRCFFSYKDENDGEPIDLYEYRNKIHSVFSVNHKSVRDLQKFTGKRLTYRKLNEYKKELRDLQDSDDFDKINKVSSLITDFYKSAYKSSDFVKEDFDSSTEFHIKYNKKRNSLQTMTKDEKGNDIIYSTGSHARHTLIQLCGYLVFLKILIEENKYPLIPIFVIDHISKPFSNQNL